MANFINIGSAGFSKSERGPIDKNIVFNDVSAMNTFVSASSGTAYAGQIISIADNQKALYKVIQSGSTYSTINLLDISSGGGTDPVPVETSPEIFEIQINQSNLLNGFNGEFSDRNFELYSLRGSSTNRLLEPFTDDLCKYLGLKDDNGEFFAQSSLYADRILRFSVIGENNNIVGYIIPTIQYISNDLIGTDVLGHWFIEYEWNNVIYKWSIEDDGGSRNPSYKFGIYIFDIQQEINDAIDEAIEGESIPDSSVTTLSEVFEIQVIESDISTGFGGLFSGEGFEFERGIAEDSYYGNFRAFYKDICKYLGFIDVWASPNIDYSSNSEYKDKILRMSIIDYFGGPIKGYILPDIHLSNITIDHTVYPCWILEYTYNNISWTWKIADDSSILSPGTNPKYPFAVYKFIPAEETQGLMGLEVVDLD